jgi:hypothetical protein
MADKGSAKAAGVRVRRGMSFMEVEFRMLQAIIRFDDPRGENMSATVGRAIRVLYEMMLSKGLLPKDPEIDPHEYQGWTRRWRIEE